MVINESDITYKIIGCAMKIHNTLGNGFQEVIYQRCLAIELERAGLMFGREAEMLNLVTKLNTSRRSNPKMTKLACKDNHSEPVYITRILTHETL